MLTLLVGLFILVVALAVAGVMAGIIAISPILLVFLCLPILDILVIKKIFKKK